MYRNITIESMFAAPIAIFLRDCSPRAVANAIAEIFATFRGGGGQIPPGVIIRTNCNPLLNSLGAQGGQASAAAGGPMIFLIPTVISVDQGADNAGGSGGGGGSPVPFIRTALGNLGLINIGTEINGYTPAQAAEIVPTIATYDQVEADLGGIIATASGQGASLGISGDIALLQQADSGLEAVTTAENSLFGG